MLRGETWIAALKLKDAVCGIQQSMGFSATDSETFGLSYCGFINNNL